MPVSLPFRMSRRISLGWRVSIGIAPFYLRPRRGASPVPERATTPSTSLKAATRSERSEEHTSELQSQSNLVCRLLLEKKNIYFCVAVADGKPIPSRNSHTLRVRDGTWLDGRRRHSEFGPYGRSYSRQTRSDHYRQSH